jgi:electron transfer flavoprotein beta subunit
VIRVAVCAKHVPAGALRLDPITLRLDRDADNELNPHDRAAVEAALRLRDDGAAGEVVLVCLGPEEAAESVREGLAMGADRACLCRDDRAAGSDLLGTSAVLARLLEREQPGLTILGQVARDSEGAVLWAAIARRLGQPVLSQAVALRIDDGQVVVRRQTERGHEIARARLPCVVSVTDAHEPRFPTFREMKAAWEKRIDVHDLDGLSIDPALVGPAGARTEVLAISPPPPSERTALLVEDEAGAAERTLAFLVERGLV